MPASGTKNSTGVSERRPGRFHGFSGLFREETLVLAVGGTSPSMSFGQTALVLGRGDRCPLSGRLARWTE